MATAISVETLTLVQSTGILTTAISGDVIRVATQLLEVGLISVEQLGEAQLQTKTAYHRASELVKHVIDQVSSSPEKLGVFLSVLEQSALFREVVEDVYKKYADNQVVRKQPHQETQAESRPDTQNESWPPTQAENYHTLAENYHTLAENYHEILQHVPPWAKSYKFMLNVLIILATSLNLLISNPLLHALLFMFIPLAAFLLGILIGRQLVESEKQLMLVGICTITIWLIYYYVSYYNMLGYYAIAMIVICSVFWSGLCVGGNPFFFFYFSTPVTSLLSVYLFIVLVLPKLLQYFGMV